MQQKQFLNYDELDDDILQTFKFFQKIIIINFKCSLSLVVNFEVTQQKLIICFLYFPGTVHVYMDSKIFYL